MRYALFTMILVLSLAGCSSTAKRNAALYEDARQAASQERQARADRLAKITAIQCPETDNGICAVAVAGFTALATVAVESSGANQTIAPPYERDWAAKLGSLSGIVGTVMTGAVSINANNNAADISIARDQSFERIVGTVAGIVPAIQPNITTTTTTTNTTTTTVGDGSAVGDGNTIANGDGNFNEGTLGNENRDASPGPFECTAGAGASGGEAAGGAGGTCTLAPEPGG